MEYLEEFKSRFENYYKKSREVTKTRENLVENIISTRRTTRAQFLTERRNIMEDLSPCPSPILMVSVAKQPQKSPPKKMDRLARMKLWKAEKMKKIEEQKAKIKPVFKVGAKANVGFPTVNESKQVVKKSFAPNNHVFKAPVNIQAIELFAVKKTVGAFKRITRSQKAIPSSPLSLPARTRKKQAAAEKKKEIKENKTKEIKTRNKLTRQNAIEGVLQESSNQINVDHKKTTKTPTQNKVQKENKELTVLLVDNIKEIKHKRRSLRLNLENNEKHQETPDKPDKNIPIVESSKKKTPKRKSMHNNIPEENTSNKRQSRRKSLRKSSSKNSDNEPDLNSTYELINPEDQITPIKDNVFTSPVAAYISPFVTTSRGKGSIKKENKERSIRGLPSFTEFNTTDEAANSSFQVSSASYFHTSLNNEISRLTSMCETWNTYKQNTENLPEDAKDLIDVAVGQANLLMNKKFQQFRNLIVACENGYGEEKPVTCEDLQGFWDMIFIQVENLNTRFNRLNELKNHNWEEIIPKVQTKVVKKAPNKKRIKSATTTSSLRAAIEAARKKTKSASSIEDTVFNGGFFVVKSPQKKSHTPEKPKTPRRSLLKTVLSSETRKSCRKTIGSPGVNMMKASATAKSVENLNFTLPTPGKSILKKPTTRKSIANTSKAVLFKDYDSDSDV